MAGCFSTDATLQFNSLQSTLFFTQLTISSKLTYQHKNTTKFNQRVQYSTDFSILLHTKCYLIWSKVWWRFNLTKIIHCAYALKKYWWFFNSIHNRYFGCVSIISNLITHLVGTFHVMHVSTKYILQYITVYSSS